MPATTASASAADGVAALIVDVVEVISGLRRGSELGEDFIDAELAYWQAAFDLEQALGERLADAAARTQ